MRTKIPAFVGIVAIPDPPEMIMAVRPWNGPRDENGIHVFDSNVDKNWQFELIRGTPPSYTLVNKVTGDRIRICEDVPNANLFTALDVASGIISDALQNRDGEMLEGRKGI
jgi:hypothetical protein